MVLIIIVLGDVLVLDYELERERKAFDLFCLELDCEFELQVLYSILSVSIYYGIHSDIRVKSNCRSNLLRVYVLNFESLDILWDSIGYRS